MKNLNKEIKIVKIVFLAISVIILIVGLGFSYLIAQLDDAPGFVIIGSTISLAGATFLYALGEIIVLLKKHNNLLLDIHQEIVDRNKKGN